MSLDPENQAILKFERLSYLGSRDWHVGHLTISFKENIYLFNVEGELSAGIKY